MLMFGFSFSNFGISFVASGNDRPLMFNVCIYWRYFEIRSGLSVVGYRHANTDHNRHL